jgi:hypothetical protein
MDRDDEKEECVSVDSLDFDETDELDPGRLCFNTGPPAISRCNFSNGGMEKSKSIGSIQCTAKYGVLHRESKANIHTRLVRIVKQMGRTSKNLSNFLG